MNITELEIKVEHIIYNDEKHKLMLLSESNVYEVYELDADKKRKLLFKDKSLEKAKEIYFEDKTKPKLEAKKSNAPAILQRIFDKYKI